MMSRGTQFVQVELYFFGGDMFLFSIPCTTFGLCNTKHRGGYESLIIGKCVFLLLGRY